MYHYTDLAGLSNLEDPVGLTWFEIRINASKGRSYQVDIIWADSSHVVGYSFIVQSLTCKFTILWAIISLM